VEAEQGALLQWAVEMLRSDLCTISSVARIWRVGGGTKLHETFVAQKMTQNNTVNKDHD